MSALGHERTRAAQQAATLDDLVGAANLSGGDYRSGVKPHTMQQCATHTPPMTLPLVVSIAEHGTS
jgi:hypothetical protein